MFASSKILLQVFVQQPANVAGNLKVTRLAFDLMGGGGYSHILTIYMGMCHWKGYGFQAIYSGIGSSNHRKLV